MIDHTRNSNQLFSLVVSTARPKLRIESYLTLIDARVDGFDDWTRSALNRREFVEW